MASFRGFTVILSVAVTASSSNFANFRKVSSGTTAEPLENTTYNVSSVSGCAVICFSQDYCAGFVLTFTQHCKLLHRNNGGNYTLMNDANSDLYLTSQLFQSRARTIVFLYFRSQSSQYVFFQGGLSAALNNGKIGITYPSQPDLRTPSNAPEYYYWSQGDQFLDYTGAEQNQKWWQTTKAAGSPGIWTTSDPNNGLYCPLNTFGDSYWMLDVTMNCMDTLTGWFEVTAVVINKDGKGNGGQTENIRQNNVCKSSFGTVATPYVTKNHVALCGMINVFRFGDGTCEIYHL